MNIKTVLLFVMLSVAVIFAGPAQAQDSSSAAGVATANTLVATATKTKQSLPQKLYGKWETPDGKYNQEWGVNINPDSTGTIEYYSTRTGCAFNAPAKVEYDGLNLKVVATTKHLRCASYFEAHLKRLDSGEFSGVIRLDVRGSSYPEVNTVIK